MSGDNSDISISVDVLPTSLENITNQIIAAVEAANGTKVVVGVDTSKLTSEIDKALSKVSGKSINLGSSVTSNLFGGTSAKTNMSSQLSTLQSLIKEYKTLGTVSKNAVGGDVFNQMQSSAKAYEVEIQSMITATANADGSINDLKLNANELASAITQMQKAMSAVGKNNGIAKQANEISSIVAKIRSIGTELQSGKLSVGNTSMFSQSGTQSIQGYYSQIESLRASLNSLYQQNGGKLIIDESNKAQAQGLIELYSSLIAKLHEVSSAANAEQQKITTAVAAAQSIVSSKVFHDAEFSSGVFKSGIDGAASLQTKLLGLKETLSGMYDSSGKLIISQENVAKANALTEAVGRINTEISRLQSKAKKDIGTQAWNNAKNSVNAYYNSVKNVASKAAPDLMEKLTQLRAAVNSGGFAGSSSAIKAQLSEIKAGMSAVGVGADTLWSKFQRLAQTKIGMMAVAQAFMYMRQSIRALFSNVVEINSAMTQLEIVTGATSGEMDTFFNEAASSAQNLGASVKDVLGSIETFSRLGFNLNDSLDLTEASTVLSNVANMSVEDATTDMTAIVKGFGLDASSASMIADELTAVGQTYAVSASELGEALTKGGSSLAASNNTLEQSIALIAAGNASVQNASSVGTALKTISARIRSSTAELEEMGEEVDDIVSSASDYRAEIKALSGVDIMANEDTYKSTYDIIKEIAAVWDTMSDIDQATLLNDLAGKRNTNVVMSMITNIKDLTGAYETASSAEGTAAEANEIFMDSTQAKINQIKATFEVFSRNFMSSDLVSGAVDGGNAILKVLDSIITSIGTVPTVAIIASIVAITKSLGITKRNCLTGEKSLVA